MPLGSCLSQLFFLVCPYVIPHLTCQMFMIFFAFPPSECDIHILRTIIFPLFTASNCLILLFSPKQQIYFSSPFKVF